jgi:vacuolar-type H+-ATPase subunit H
MSVADLSRAVLRVQYRIARFPLELVEEQVVRRLDSEAPLRLVYERSLGALDAVVGNVLGVPALARRGTTKIVRSDKLMRAADLDAVADATIAQADSELKDARGAATQAVEDARAETARVVEQAQDTAEERKQAAIKTADQRANAAKKQADEAAAQRKGAAHAAKRVEHAVIRADQKLAEADAQAKLDAAQDNRSVAARKRAEADRLEDLADEEKAKRRSARSTRGS